MKLDFSVAAAFVSMSELSTSTTIISAGEQQTVNLLIGGIQLILNPLFIGLSCPGWATSFHNEHEFPLL